MSTGATQTTPESAAVLHGEQALIASVGGARYFADWTKPDHRLRRLLAEFIGTSGLTFALSGGAAVSRRGNRNARDGSESVLSDHSAACLDSFRYA